MEDTGVRGKRVAATPCIRSTKKIRLSRQTTSGGGSSGMRDFNKYPFNTYHKEQDKAHHISYLFFAKKAIKSSFLFSTKQPQNSTSMRHLGLLWQE